MLRISGTTTLVGIIGWPVAHSLSPRMQNAAFAAAGLDWAYVPLPVAPDHVGDAIRGLAALGLAGANVTIPHKRAVIPYCDEIDPVAANADSVNTLVVRDGRVLASSTDILALQRAVDAAGRRVLILGRGGAALAAQSAYASQGAAGVRLASRSDPDWPPAATGWDVVVNCTPMTDDPMVELTGSEAVVDMAYLADGAETALVRAARSAGCSCVVDGLELLLWQGAASFERWTGMPAPIDAMRAALRDRSYTPTR